MTGRAIVLGGGGVTGIAWEIGVLVGLADGGADLHADAVFGTSAGAFVGAALASGADLETLFAAQQREAHDEPVVRLPKRVFAAWVWAYIRGSRNPQRTGARLGAIARRRRPIIPPEQRRRTVESRLTTSDWPEALRVTAINAVTGELRVFERSDGASLVDAVSASGAVPGISPPVEIDGQLWIDGGMVSPANARLAEGFDEVLVIAPMTRGPGGLPSAEQDAKALSSRASVQLIAPDEASKTAIGPNIYDASRRAEAATAGRAQGAAAAR
jgi:NTE family protein